MLLHYFLIQTLSASTDNNILNIINRIAIVLAIVLNVLFSFVVLSLLGWNLDWVYRDAERRGKPGCAVVLMVLFLGWPISLLVWYIFRPENEAD